MAPGSQVVLRPWHLHRHMWLWDNPDGFDPERWQNENGKYCQRAAFIPFSAGPRVCTGAGFAMLEGVLLLARFCAAYEFTPIAEAGAATFGTSDGALSQWYLAETATARRLI